jgi:signal transduction histidine kinase
MAILSTQRPLTFKRWLGCWCALLLYLIAFCSLASAMQIQHITQAHVLDGRDLSVSIDAPAITLPHDWNAVRPQKHGTATYLITFTLSKTDLDTPLAVYLPRIGNRYEIFINDELVHASPSLNDTRLFETHKAAFSKLPKNAVFAGVNTLKVVLAGEAARYAGLSSVHIGNYTALNEAYNNRQMFQSFTTLAIVIVCLFIAFLTIFYSYFSRNRHFFWFGVGALAWALNNSYLLLSSFPYNYRIALFFYDFFYAVGICLMLLTTAHTVRVRAKWYPTLMVAYLYASFAALVIYHDGYPIARTFFLDGTVLLGCVSFALFVKASLTNRKKRSWVVFFTLLAALGLGIYDQLAVYHNPAGFERISYSRYSVILFIVANATSMAQQIIKINLFVHKSHARMGNKLQMMKHRLSQSFKNRAIVDKKLTLQQERWRLMQDMHDGLGHRLIGLQQAVQDPAQSGDSLNAMVKQTIEELRTTIQSIHQTHNNVSYMLGDLRERLDFLCEQYKKQLHWSVDEMPTLSSIDDSKIASIEKILLEIFTNIAKHSCATKVKLTATYAAQQAITITVEENGLGFSKPSIDQAQSVSSNTQRGLVGIERRAKDISAILRFEDNGKTIRLTVPLT